MVPYVRTDARIVYTSPSTAGGLNLINSTIQFRPQHQHKVFEARRRAHDVPERDIERALIRPSSSESQTPRAQPPQLPVLEFLPYVPQICRWPMMASRFPGELFLITMRLSFQDWQCLTR